ncbi:hypothetical protein FSP39_021986 [Pinctada imbricata]|uniref:Neurotransmitter-gated ion-channel ligand-binding domain-containing protein n=1 Tax=Pinctada imbricata TaxID=66713 RepID=A0AA89C493_PINIB|nr:hypothetical protein FSP39_021986 [Pinctada imbricata]
MSTITVLIVCFLFTSAHSVSFETSRRLFNDLTENDTKYIRPVLNQSHAVDVHVSVRAYNLKMFDVTLGKFSLLSSFLFDWKDEYKKWDPRKYDGLRKIHLPKSNVWVPNILIENSADLTAILTNDNSHFELEVMNDGRISMSVPAVFEVLCEPNIQKYPFDEHECAIVFTN